MKLEKINISNYKSIDSLDLKIEELEDDSKTFCLIGLNESGKTSILKGISLFDEHDILDFKRDYYDKEKKVIVSFYFVGLSDVEIGDVKNLLINGGLPEDICENITIQSVEIKVSFANSASTEKLIEEKIEFNIENIKGYNFIDKTISPAVEGDTDTELNLNKYFSENYPDYFYMNHSPNVVFWESKPEFLLEQEIDLTLFSSSPSKTSRPLKNCFALAGITTDANIKKSIEGATTPEDILNLSELLTNKVTEHINEKWPEHKVKIKFAINNNKISPVVEDIGVSYNNKTIEQRSDGFKQFLSFLLTSSAENTSLDFSRTLLLLDEPETHLHPTAQEYLLEELVKLTDQEENNNLVIFATHSNYMIDKNLISRSTRVYKENNKTYTEELTGSGLSYAEVNHTVFNIPTNDFHNELYGYIESENKTLLDGLPKDMDWHNDKSKNTYKASLSQYIRDSIHHPENKTNPTFTREQLKQSIEILRNLKGQILN